MTQLRDGAKEQLRRSLDLEAKHLDAIRAGYQAVADETAATLAKLQPFVQDGSISRSELYKFNRLEKIQAQILGSLDKLHAGQAGELNKYLGEQFDLGYFFTGYTLEKGAGLSLAYAALDPQAMQAAALSPLSKISLQDAAEQTRQRIRKSLVISTAQGEGITKLGARIRDDLGQNANDVYRIARTETTRVNNEAQQASFAYAQSRGLPLKREWISTLDAKTRESHQRLDGEVRGLDEPFSNGLMQPGELGGPPQEVIRCRCTMGAVLVGYEDEKGKRRARSEVTGKNEVIKDVPYDTWRQKNVAPLPPAKAAQAATQAAQAAQAAAAAAKAQQAIIDAQNAQIRAQAIADIQAQKAANDAADAARKAAAEAKRLAEEEAARLAAEAAAQAKPYVDKYKTAYADWAKTKPKSAKALAQELLDGEGIPLQAELASMKGARGSFSFFRGPTGEVRPHAYKLQSGDKRPMDCRVKTAFHELYHTKATGLISDEGYILGARAYNNIEETFAECYGHFAAKQMGITSIIPPSYGSKLIDMLPRLKQLPEFSSCNTIADFGRVVEKYRFGPDATAGWLKISNAATAIPHNVYTYGKQYSAYIADHTEDLLQHFVTQGSLLPDQIDFAAKLVPDILLKIETGTAGTMTSLESSIYEDLLANAMNLEGIK